jgi:hypothetical protein
MYDILNNQPAKPGTVFPGRWLVDLPSHDSFIHIRRYCPSQATKDEHSAVNGVARILEKLRNDPLEQGWRAVNRVQDQGGGGGPRRILMEGNGICGVVVKPSKDKFAEGASGTEVAVNGDGGQRELWCFAVREGDVEEVVMPLAEDAAFEGKFWQMMMPYSSIGCLAYYPDLLRLRVFKVDD